MTSTDKTPRRTLTIDHTWDGILLGDAERARVHLRLTDSGDLEVFVDAPFYGDPPPAAAPGPTDKLWEHEVVEVFIAGDHDHYTELELGPHGHYLLIRLHGYRQEHDRPLLAALNVFLDVAANRWTACALIAQHNLPTGAWRANAYAIHGQGEARRYLAAHPMGGPRPDFHRLDAFCALD